MKYREESVSCNFDAELYSVNEREMIDLGSLITGWNCGMFLFRNEAIICKSSVTKFKYFFSHIAVLFTVHMKLLMNVILSALCLFAGHKFKVIWTFLKHTNCFSIRKLHLHFNFENLVNIQHLDRFDNSKLNSLMTSFYICGCFVNIKTFYII